MRLLLDGKIQEAIELLDDETLRRSIAQAEQKIADAVQGWLLKARLFSLRFRFEEAVRAYESALRQSSARRIRSYGRQRRLR